MPSQPIDLRKCLSCQRWQGWRKFEPVTQHVEYDEARPEGECKEGPWHGSLRTVKNACGRWLQWQIDA